MPQNVFNALPVKAKRSGGAKVGRYDPVSGVTLGFF
jgi:hypothetical protein